MDNLALSCLGCNSHKYTNTHARDPDTGRRVPLYNGAGEELQFGQSLATLRGEDELAGAARHLCGGLGDLLDRPNDPDTARTTLGR